MLGLLRFLLAYLVVISHLVGSDYLAHFGFYAVVGFFVIAGFFMTSALNEIYRFDGVRFCINRSATVAAVLSGEHDYACSHRSCAERGRTIS